VRRVSWTLVFVLSAIAAGAASAQTGLSLALQLVSEEHRVETGLGALHTNGVLPGVMVAYGFGSRWRVQLSARSGTLAASSRPADDEDVADVTAIVGATPAPWVSFELIGTARSVTTALARQHWTSAGIGTELRMPFLGSATEGFLHFGVPLVTGVSGLAAPAVAVEGSAGLRYRLGRITGQLSYALRRFDFPPAGGQTRLEQISTLTLGVGVLVGRRGL
jgi:hypothetical protein